MVPSCPDPDLLQPSGPVLLTQARPAALGPLPGPEDACVRGLRRVLGGSVASRRPDAWAVCVTAARGNGGRRLHFSSAWPADRNLNLGMVVPAHLCAELGTWRPVPEGRGTGNAKADLAH